MEREKEEKETYNNRNYRILRKIIMNDKKMDFKQIKEEEIKIALQLCYPKKVIKKLEAAETESELYRIMVSARQNLED